MVSSWPFSSWTLRLVEKENISMPVFTSLQGTFDYRTTVRENMTVFALSTMTSSVLVYNVQHGIREDHLQVSPNLSSNFSSPSCSICSCSLNMAEWPSRRQRPSPSRSFNSWYYLQRATQHLVVVHSSENQISSYSCISTHCTMQQYCS